MSEVTTRCTLCAAEFTDAELEGATRCPKCGTEGLPCIIAEDVTVKINWHELRILGIWASFWAGTPDFPAHSRGALSAILKRLEAQHPDKVPLSLAGEVRQLQDTMPGVELRDGSGNVIVPAKKIQ